MILKRERRGEQCWFDLFKGRKFLFWVFVAQHDTKYRVALRSEDLEHCKLHAISGVMWSGREMCTRLELVL